jgi:probable F420-dependent oxidoreductase
MSRPTLHLTLPNFGPFLGSELAAVVDIARRTEEAGLDGVIVVDHVLIGNRTDRYRWGPFPYPDPTVPWMEPLTTLAVIAGATERVRLGTGIVVAALRPAAVLAKTVATLDLLSGGRVDLGVGGGWQPEEFGAVGLDFTQRGTLLTETLAACRVLWTQWPAAFAGEHVSFADVWCSPRPVQPGGVPILVAGPLTAANVNRVVEHGAGWIPIMGATSEDIGAGIAELRAAFTAAGRDAATLRVRAPLGLGRDGDGRPDVAASVARSRDLYAMGVGEVVTALQPYCATLADVPAYLEALGAAWRAEWGP